ncbi:hypothetical protein [Treponema pectinovorum]|uniref:hypothetical protein n=1 Tax=Treponema pectinovorum TaxID=164 RepID=UPI001659B831|nr:hypothetical protein [Treponema pectinovorum]
MKETLYIPKGFLDRKQIALSDLKTGSEIIADLEKKLAEKDEEIRKLKERQKVK